MIARHVVGTGQERGGIVATIKNSCSVGKFIIDWLLDMIVVNTLERCSILATTAFKW